MTEHGPRPTRSPFAEAFGLSEHEELFDRVSDVRFQALFDMPNVFVDTAHLDSNTYGEFLFITLRTEQQGKQFFITFYSLGLHESREQWLTTEWHFYFSDSRTPALSTPLLKNEVQALTQQRRADVALWAQTSSLPSKRALLFRLLADLTDEDGAYTELEDMGDMDWFDDEPE